MPMSRAPVYLTCVYSVSELPLPHSPIFGSKTYIKFSGQLLLQVTRGMRTLVTQLGWHRLPLSNWGL